MAKRSEKQCEPWRRWACVPPRPDGGWKSTRSTHRSGPAQLGTDKVLQRPLIMGGEDFGRFGRAGVPIFMYFLGTSPPDKVAEAAREGARPLPSMHSDLYYPVPEPSIRTGVLTMSAAVLNLVGK